MVSAIQHATGAAAEIQTRPAPGPTAVSPKPTPPTPQPAAPTTADTVQISNAALTAMKEATETPAETAKEARSGDHQAQRLVAKEAATKKLEG
jgi:hypothetical protein